MCSLIFFRLGGPYINFYSIKTKQECLEAHWIGFFVWSENGLLCFAEQEMDQFDLIPYVLPPACSVALTVQGYFSLRRGRTSARQSRGSSTGCSCFAKCGTGFSAWSSDQTKERSEMIG